MKCSLSGVQQSAWTAGAVLKALILLGIVFIGEITHKFQLWRRSKAPEAPARSWPYERADISQRNVFGSWNNAEMTTSCFCATSWIGMEAALAGTVSTNMLLTHGFSDNSSLLFDHPWARKPRQLNLTSSRTAAIFRRNFARIGRKLEGKKLRTICRIISANARTVDPISETDLNSPSTRPSCTLGRVQVQAARLFSPLPPRMGVRRWRQSTSIRLRLGLPAHWGVGRYKRPGFSALYHRAWACAGGDNRPQFAFDSAFLRTGACAGKFGQHFSALYHRAWAYTGSNNQHYLRAWVCAGSNKQRLYLRAWVCTGGRGK